MSYKIVIFWWSLRPNRKNRIFKNGPKKLRRILDNGPSPHLKKHYLLSIYSIEKSNFCWVFIVPQKILPLALKNHCWPLQKVFFKSQFPTILTTSYFAKWSLSPFWRRSLCMSPWGFGFDHKKAFIAGLTLDKAVGYPENTISLKSHSPQG